MAKQSSVNLDITNNPDGFDISGGTTLRKLSVTGGNVTIAGSGSATVTFPTTSTTVAGLGIAQSFTALQTFSAGISASGATFSGNISAPNIVNSLNGFTGAVQVTGSGAILQTVSGTTTTFGARLASSSTTGVASFGNEFTVSAAGAVGLTSNYVKSVNGLTGAVVSIATTGSNTFTGLNSFNAGISAAGGVTFSGDIAVQGGDITTTSATATLYNTNATTVNIGNAASTVSVMGGTASARLNIGSNSYVKTGSTTTTTTAKQLIFSFQPTFGTSADTYFADIIITANYGNIVLGSIGSQITKMLVTTSQLSTINHTEYGNVNTSGNLAVYTAELVGSAVYIYATPTNGFSTVFNVYATLIKGTHGFGEE